MFLSYSNRFREIKIKSRITNNDFCRRVLSKTVVLSRENSVETEKAQPGKNPEDSIQKKNGVLHQGRITSRQEFLGSSGIFLHTKISVDSVRCNS